MRPQKCPKITLNAARPGIRMREAGGSEPLPGPQHRNKTTTEPEENSMTKSADLDAPILDVLAGRWSTQVFDPYQPLDEVALRSALEAARWAPSARNSQPWRFIVARRGSIAHEKVASSLRQSNASWATAASALIVALAVTIDDAGTELPWADYDTGQAVAHFTIQSHANGIATHQMGGFNPDLIRGSFALPPHVSARTVMAFGMAGDVGAAPEYIRQRELSPRTRRGALDSVLLDE